MRRKTVAAWAAVVGILTSNVSAFAGPKGNNGRGNNSSVNTPATVVVQGTITAIQGNWLTVKTLQWQPSNPPGTYAPQYVIAGTTFRVNVSHAVEETFSGSTVKPTLFVGELIVAVGVRDHQGNEGEGNGVTTSQTLTAQIVEQIAGGNNIGGGVTTTAASLRIR